MRLSTTSACRRHWISRGFTEEIVGTHATVALLAHADQEGLLERAEQMRKKPGKIQLVHGVPMAQKTLAAKSVKNGYDVECYIFFRRKIYEKARFSGTELPGTTKNYTLPRLSRVLRSGLKAKKSLCVK
jgi:Cft2 family RNA processing exonuclease